MHMKIVDLYNVYCVYICIICDIQCSAGVYWVQGWLSGSFSDDAEQELWDVLGSNPALHS